MTNPRNSKRSKPAAISESSDPNDQMVDRLAEDLQGNLIPLAIERGLIDSDATVEQLARDFLAIANSPEARTSERYMPTLKAVARDHLGWLADQIRTYRYYCAEHPNYWTAKKRQLYADGIRNRSAIAETLLGAVEVAGPSLTEHCQELSRRPRKAPEWDADRIEADRLAYVNAHGKAYGWVKALSAKTGLSERALSVRRKKTRR